MSAATCMGKFPNCDKWKNERKNRNVRKRKKKKKKKEEREGQFGEKHESVHACGTCRMYLVLLKNSSGCLLQKTLNNLGMTALSSDMDGKPSPLNKKRKYWKE